MTFLTDFADQAVVLPLVVAIAVVLALQGWRRGAVAWLGAIGATLGVMLALKLFFLGCASVFDPVGMRSPSGHVAAAAVLSGGVAAIFGVGRRTIAVVVVLAAVGIGLTRVGLQVHSWPEVVLGGAVGLVGALALALCAGPPPALRLWPMILTAVVVATVSHGRHLEAEVAIQQAAMTDGWCHTSRPTL